MYSFFRFLSNCKRVSVSVLIGVVLFYVGFQLLNGEHGLIGHAIEKRQQAQLVKALKEVRQERARLERDISLLSGKEIDADLLGELARRQLPVAGKNEIIIVQ